MDRGKGLGMRIRVGGKGAVEMLGFVFDEWRIKVNAQRRSSDNFTLQRFPWPAASLNQTLISPSDTVRYLGIHLDQKLTWSNYSVQKRPVVNSRFSMLWRIFGKYSQLSLTNQRDYFGLKLWGSDRPFNVNHVGARSFVSWWLLLSTY